MKSILKLSKKFLLLILIIVLPINSFAAVSVSDGSAFVSKSEFSSTINNLSNRVSTIENTLDAKIDSLVSSYLSRNGIWNGDKQTISYTSNNLGLGPGTNSTNYILLHQYYKYTEADGWQTKIETVANQRPVVQIGENTTNRSMIANITKSGLICIKYNFFRYAYNGSTKSSTVSIQPAALTTNATFYPDRYSEQNYINCTVSFYLHQNDWVDPSTSSLGVISNSLTIFAQAIPQFEEFGSTLYTFVEKGKPLRVTEVISTSIPVGCCWKRIAGSGNVSGKVLFQFVPTSAYVY